MVDKKFQSIIKQRRDTAENWNNSNPVLYESEFGIETDTGYIKLGNGVTPWKDLQYINYQTKSKKKTDKLINIINSSKTSLISIEPTLTNVKNFYVSNKNLFNSNLLQGNWDTINNSLVADTKYVTSNKISIVANKDYILSFTGLCDNLYIYFYDKDNTYLQTITELNVSTYKFNVNVDCDIYISFYKKAGISVGDITNIQLEIGTIATDYIEHQSQMFNIYNIFATELYETSNIYIENYEEFAITYIDDIDEVLLNILRSNNELQSNVSGISESIYFIEEDILGLKDNIDNLQDIKNEVEGKITKWDTAYEHSQLDHAPTNAQENLIETIKVNNKELTPTDKAVNITVPTKVSELTNDSGYKTTDYIHPSYTARTGVPTSNQTPAFGDTFSVSQPISNSTGHITAMNTRTITIPNAIASQSVNGLQSANDKQKLDYTNIAYGVCSTAAATAEKEVTISGNNNWKLEKGSIIIVKFENTNTATGVTLNVNSTGAKSIWVNIAEYTSYSPQYCGYAKRNVTYMYDGTYWVWISGGYDANTTYTNASLGQGYGTCTTAEDITDKIVVLSGYALSVGGIIAVKFTYAVPEGSTMNINNRGAKPIYYKGNAISSNIINADDTALFIYNGSQYHLLSIDSIDENSTSAINADTLDGKHASDFAEYSHDHPVSDIIGLTATIDELNYTGGLTSNIQTQLDNKAKSIDLTNHIKTVNNPHNVTKEQLGLDNVENKSARDIISEITKADIENLIGEVKSGIKVENCYGQNLNELTSSGYFYGQNLTNTPDDTYAWFIIVYNIIPSICVQIAISADKQANNQSKSFIYLRTKFVAWHKWVDMGVDTEVDLSFLSDYYTKEEVDERIVDTDTLFYKTKTAVQFDDAFKENNIMGVIFKGETTETLTDASIEKSPDNPSVITGVESPTIFINNVENYFDNSELIYGAYSVATGVKTSSKKYLCNKNKIALSKGKYRLKYSHTGVRHIHILKYDITDKYLGYKVILASGSDEIVDFEMESDGYACVNFAGFAGNDIQLSYISNIILYKQEDEGFKTSKLCVGETLHKLTDDVYDEFNAVTGKLIKRVGKLVLDGSRNIDYSKFLITYGSDIVSAITFFPSEIGLNENTSGLYCDKLNTFIHHDLILHQINSIQLGVLGYSDLKKRVAIVFDKELENPFLFSDWLSENPITIYYELEQPEVYYFDSIDVNSFIGIKNILSYPLSDIDVIYSDTENKYIDIIGKEVSRTSNRVLTIENKVGNNCNSSTIVVASSTSLEKNKLNADFVCTGQNDEEVIQLAIDSISTVGGKIILHEGDYYINNTINLNVDNIYLCGCGTATKLYREDDGDSINPIMFNVSANNITLKDMYLYDNSTISIYNSLIYSETASNDLTLNNLYFKTENVNATNFVAEGIFVRMRMINCYIDRNFESNNADIYFKGGTKKIYILNCVGINEAINVKYQNVLVISGRIFISGSYYIQVYNINSREYEDYSDKNMVSL